MGDETLDIDHVAVQEALYRAASDAAGFELLLNSMVTIDGTHAAVRSICVVLGGELRDPKITSCQRVIDSLHRDSEGRWRVDSRTTEGCAVRQPLVVGPA